MKMADDEFKAEEIKKARMMRNKQKPFTRIAMEASRICASRQEVMETVILEKTIIKLGSLLALGFGEAGADIIGKNMSGSDSAGVNAMVPGRKCECIVGILRVRDFSTATEVLQAKVMMFSNQIAEIVHGVCNEFHGAPNKNTGDSFLVIWKESSDAGIDGTELMQKYAEGAIVSSACVIGAVHHSPLLGSYREHPGLQYRLGSNCRVHLSIGLHKGWAIEGAVGSEFKIDCSYLSPNVSIATSIERSTEAYGVSVMVAQSVVDLCDYPIRSQCRLIDKVIVRGSPAPMELYCVDLDYMSVEVDRTSRPKVPWNTRQRFKVRQQIEQEKKEVLQKDLADIFVTDEVILQMRERFTVEFFQLFNMGYQNYSQGEWQVARRMLMHIKSQVAKEDGPSTALLKFMEVPYGFEAPKGWQGIRELVC
ncbi:cya [Symbiodinium pilosum]|uniref:Cya protein n=1 Tax=Symbiodinium pilosum TaxID=2952 RepID=A0A812U1C3_SYMPI|nr:cya [Symbiodinium pilosum]